MKSIFSLLLLCISAIWSIAQKGIIIHAKPRPKSTYTPPVVPQSTTNGANNGNTPIEEKTTTYEGKNTVVRTQIISKEGGSEDFPPQIPEENTQEPNSNNNTGSETINDQNPSSTIVHKNGGVSSRGKGSPPYKPKKPQTIPQKGSSTIIPPQKTPPTNTNTNRKLHPRTMMRKLNREAPQNSEPFPTNNVQETNTEGEATGEVVPVEQTPPELSPCVPDHVNILFKNMSGNTINIQIGKYVKYGFSPETYTLRAGEDTEIFVPVTQDAPIQYCVYEIDERGKYVRSDPYIKHINPSACQALEILYFYQ